MKRIFYTVIVLSNFLEQVAVPSFVSFRLCVFVCVPNYSAYLKPMQLSPSKYLKIICLDLNVYVKELDKTFCEQ